MKSFKKVTKTWLIATAIATLLFLPVIDETAGLPPELLERPILAALVYGAVAGLFIMVVVELIQRE